MRIEVLLDGEPLTRWALFSRYEITLCKVILPARLMAGRTLAGSSFMWRTRNPPSARRGRGEQVIGEDPRELGIKIQRIEFASKDRLRYILGTPLDFTATAKAADHADERWGPADSFGVWTLVPIHRDALAREPVDSPVAAIFTVNDVAVNQRIRIWRFWSP